MHCPYCNTVNDDENSFCVSCGKTIPQDYKTHPNVLPPTQVFQSNQPNEPQSVQTAYPPKSYPSAPPPVINQPPVYEQPKKGGKGLILAGLAVAVLIVLGALAAGGFYFWQQQQKQTPQTAEVLPGHIGMFVQTADKKAVNEIKKLDAVNALDDAEKLLSDDALPAWEENASLILFSDAKEIPVTDLKLVQLDTIEESGNFKQIDFQAAPLEGKPEMKRLRVSGGLAKGKYAFALFNGFLNEGNHKFWAFQVKDSKKADNDDIAKSASIPVKPADKDKPKETETADKKDAPTPPKDTKVAPPSGARVAYCNGSNVVLRGSPSLTGKKIGSLSLKQRIYIINYSENYDEWRGTTANWAYIQTESGGRGWVFTPFVDY